jgi:hypothetical protein
MAKLFSVICFGFAALLLASCGVSSGDALASYVDRQGKRHVITRGEVYRNMGQGREQMLEDSSRQRAHIENMLFRDILRSEALYMGLNKEERYISEKESFATNQLLLSEFFDQNFNRENLKFKLPAYEVRLILLRRERHNRVMEPDPNRFQRMEHARATITNDPARLRAELARLENATIARNVPKTVDEMGDHEVSLMSAAQGILERLKEPGADFAAIARERSAHESRANGGLIGFILPRQEDIPFPVNKAIASLKVGDHTEAINTEAGYYIAKLERVVTVTHRNIEKYIPEAAEGQPRHAFFRQTAWFGSVWAFIDNTLERELGRAITINYEGLESDDTNTILLSIKSPQFNTDMTLGRLLHTLDFTSPPRRARMGLIHSNLPVGEYSPAELRIFFDQMLSTPVLNYAAHKRGVMKTRPFRQALADASQNILIRMAQDRFNESLRQIEAADVEEYYENNLDKFVTRVRAGVNADGSPRYTERQRPLDDDLREQIWGDLYNQWSTESYENWRNDLFTRYQVRIYENRFEVVKKTEPGHVHGADCRH